MIASSCSVWACVVGRPAAEPRDLQRDPQRMGRADRRLEVDDLLQQRLGHGERDRLEAVDGLDVLLEGEREELDDRVGDGSVEVEREVAVKAPGGQLARDAHRLLQRPDQRGGQQPGALVDGVGVGPQLGRDRRHDDQAVGVDGRRDDDRMLVARARRGELLRPVLQFPSQQRAQLADAVARGIRPARIGQDLLDASDRRPHLHAAYGDRRARLSVATRTLGDRP